MDIKISIVPIMLPIHYILPFILMVCFFNIQADSSISDIVEKTFNTANEKAKEIRKNSDDVLKNISDLYGSTIAEVIQYALKKEINEETVINTLHPKLLKHFNVKKINKNSSDEAFALVGKQFEAFENTANDYHKTIAQIINDTKSIYGANQDIREHILYAFEEYVRILIREYNTIQKIFRTKTIPNATKQILSEELKNKNQVECRLIISLLINTIIDQSGAAASAKIFQEKGKEITQKVINWFQNADMESISTTIQEKLKKDYPSDELYIILTALKNFLYFVIAPKQLPQATSWTPPTPSCSWYNLSCSIPWNKIGDSLKDIFQDQVGGALKTAFVDNVYEKGLKKIGEETVKEFTVCADARELRMKRYYKISIRETIFSEKLTDFSVGFGEQTSIQPLIGARKIAQGTLDAAKKILEAGRKTATGAIGVARETATGILSAEETVVVGVLTVAEETVQAMMSAFDIQHIRYEGSLKELASGSLGNVTCKAIIAGKSLDFSFDLDIHGPLKSIERLADRIADKFMETAKKAVDKLQEGARSLHLSQAQLSYDDIIKLTIWNHTKEYIPLKLAHNTI